MRPDPAGVGARSNRQIDSEIARLAIPALGTLLAEPLYVLTDTAIVGHLGTEQLAGLALASTVLLSGYAVFVFLAYGTTAAVARLLGAGHRDAAAHNGVQSIWLAVMLSVVVTTLGGLFGHDLLRLLGGSHAVLSYAWTYLWISLAGVPALMIALAGTGYLRGLQNTRIPLVVTVIGVALNLIIEVLLIFGFGFGIGASALASVVAQWVVAGAYLWFIAREVRRFGVSLSPHFGAIAGLMRVGADLLVRTVALRSTLIVATSVAAGMGAVSLAAHQIVFEIWNFLAMVLDSIAIAAQAMIGRLLGRDDSDGARSVARRMLIWSMGLGVASLVVLGALSGVVGRLFSPDPDVLTITAHLVLIAALWQPVNSIAFTLDGILIGAGDTRYLAASMLLAAAVFIPVAVLVGRSGLGVEWLWVALGVLMLIRVATLGARFLTGRWARTGERATGAVRTSRRR